MLQLQITQVNKYKSTLLQQQQQQRRRRRQQKQQQHSVMSHLCYTFAAGSANSYQYVTWEACHCVVLMLQQRGLVCVGVCNMGFGRLRPLIFKVDVRIRSAWNTSGTYGPLLLIRGRHLGAETCRSWHLMWSVFCHLFCCISISAFCWFKICNHLQNLFVYLVVRDQVSHLYTMMVANEVLYILMFKDFR
jgi:hypothetical protein